MLKAVKLRCENLYDPLAIDTRNPSLSWIIDSDEINVVQQAYQIMVFDTEGGIVWDSGKVVSEYSFGILYSGPKLKPRATVCWQVKVWDNHGEESSWSEKAFWKMGLLSSDEWLAEWIGLDKEAYQRISNTEYKAPCLFRKEFESTGNLKSAMLYVSSLGWNEFFINGNKVGDVYFSPGWTDYQKRIYYNAYNVSDMISEGKNAIGAVLAGGWAEWPGYKCNMRLYGQLELFYNDGSSKVITTSPDWKAVQGPERYAHILFGESCDMRKAVSEWDMPDFDDSSWESPAFGPLTFDGVETSPPLEAYPAEPVKKVAEHVPANIIPLIPWKTYIVDMGTYYSGFARITMKDMKYGQAIKLRFGDWLRSDGSLYTDNLRLASHQLDEFISDGTQEEDTWEPKFTFRGHRYIEVSGWYGAPVELTQENIRGIELTQGAQQTTTFSCGNPLVEKLFAAVSATQRANTIEIPTDCPQRDERRGWGGDALLFAPTACYLADLHAFYRKWLQTVLDSQVSDGAFANVSPSGLGTGPGKPGWADVGAVLPWIVFQRYGDIELLKKHYPASFHYVSFRLSMLENFIKRDDEPFFGDWLAIDTPSVYETSEWGADNAITYIACTARMINVVALTAQTLGNTKDVHYLNDVYQQIKSAFNQQYVNSDGMKHPTQGNCALALAYELIDEPVRQKVAEQLVNEFRKRNWCIGTGFISTEVALQALSENGYADEAYNILLNENFPSWGFMMNTGATSIWEHWGSQRPDLPPDAGVFKPCDSSEHEGPGLTRRIGPGMNSACHPPLASVGAWIVENIGGLRTIEPGFKRFMIKPLPDQRIKHASLCYESTSGSIISNWQLDDKGVFKMEVEIPPNSNAEIHVPLNYNAIDHGELNQADILRKEDECTVFSAGSGKYGFAGKKGFNL